MKISVNSSKCLDFILWYVFATGIEVSANSKLFLKLTDTLDITLQEVGLAPVLHYFNKLMDIFSEPDYDVFFNEGSVFSTSSNIVATQLLDKIYFFLM